MDETGFLDEQLERDIKILRDRVRKMSKMVLEQVDNAVKAFTEGNRKLAYTVVLKDHRIDVFEDHIDRLCQEFLVRHMPVSEQLRFVIAVAKVNSELERIGDYAESIALRAANLADEEDIPQRDRIVEMSGRALEMLADAISSFLDGDMDKVVTIHDSDRIVNRMNSEIFDSLVNDDDTNPNLHVSFALVRLINRIERIADRACNIAEEAVYVYQGEIVRHLPREDMRVLFLCDHNSCRSQMAEGIARTIAPTHFIFSSAGTTPTRLDPKAVEFMRGKGVDISRQRSKGLEGVGKIDDFNIVITLSEGVEKAIRSPYHVVQLYWEIPNPSALTGSDEEIQAAYLETYDRLQQKIKDLTEGLAGASESECEE